MLLRKKILVAPLNWGLGHATRVIPIIRELIIHEAEVIIAADGRALELLRKEFPLLKWIRLQGFEIQYDEKRSLPLQLMLQLPKFIRSIFAEQKQLDKIIDDERIHAVIADNCYGLHSKKIPCIFITHQTGIIVPKSIKWTATFLNRINHFLISKFDACWIPDFEGENNLSGALSHKYQLPGKASFIGPLSRFTFQESNKKYDLVIVLSGPEPQRTALERIVVEQVNHFIHQAENSSFMVLLVRGIPEGSNQVTVHELNFSQADYLPAEELNDAILSSKMILSRPGYSTVMDLATLGSKAIFIPTPGQTEQEYLAEYLMKKKIFYAENQQSFNLQRALYAGADYSGIQVNGNLQWLELLTELLDEN
ncbi:MAG TPA: glycosyltransferase family protein [Chitinophagales bacterium]|nr:glycosyltransferase family protein [Chitinophagales bacterium]